MTKKEKAALNEDAVMFVHRVITEVYGQEAKKHTVSATARRVVATLPTASGEPVKAAKAHKNGAESFAG